MDTTALTPTLSALRESPRLLLLMLCGATLLLAGCGMLRGSSNGCAATAQAAPDYGIPSTPLPAQAQSAGRAATAAGTGTARSCRASVSLSSGRSLP